MFLLLAMSLAHAAPICEAAAKLGWREVDGHLMAPENGPLDLRPEPAALVEMSRMIRGIEALGTEVVVVVTPPRARVVQSPGRGSAAPRYWLDDRAAFAGILQWFRAQGADAPDLMELGLEMGTRGERMFRPEDGHLTAAGSIAAAGMIADAIRGQGKYAWLGQSPASLRVDGVDRPRPGALAAELAEVCKATSAPSFEQPRYVLDRAPVDGSLLLADVPEPEVVMVSSSFGNPMFFLPQALEAEIDAPILNITYAGGRVASAARSWLESENFRLDKPDVLVWVFGVHHLYGQAAAHGATLGNAEGFRQLWPLVDGGCNDANAARVLSLRDDGTLLPATEAAVPTRGHYVVVESETLRAVDFSLRITYDGGASETVRLPPDERAPLRPSAMLALNDAMREARIIRIVTPEGTKLDDVKARVCRATNPALAP
ncbi:MAG: hypothetical protein FJ102_10255 [Deltaproteobacteria bacterium]|nr:hypothetical protein [Deltaproteobacteria bacterium]